MNKFPSVTYPAMDLSCIFPVSQSLQGVEFNFANMAATDKKKNEKERKKVEKLTSLVALENL